MLITTYGRSQILRIASFLIVVLLLGLTANKLYYSFSKIYDYSKAKSYSDKHEMISAEEHYSKASLNGYLHYHDSEITNRLEDLKPVTEIKANMQSIIQQSNESLKSGDAATLAASYERYQTSKKNAAGKGTDYQVLFTGVTGKFEMEKHFEDVFVEFTKDISKLLLNEAKKKSFSDGTVASLLAIPAPYFGTPQQRQSALREKLEPYDQARMDALAAKAFPDFIAEGVRLGQFYANHHVQPDWLLPEIEQYAIAHFQALVDKKDTEFFSKDAKMFERVPELATNDSKVLAYITTAYTKQLEQAEQLGKQNKYAQAIEAYKTLGGYRDTSKRIQNIELQWASEEPAHILQKVLPDKKFSSVINGKDQMGAIVFAIGITDGKLVLARMLPDMSMDKKEANLDKTLKTKNIRIVGGASMSGNPTLVVEAGSSARKSRYVGFDVQASGLKKIFDIEADGYEMEKTGLMVVDNPLGNGAGQNAFYSYQNGEYSYSGIKPDYVEISLKDLRKYKNAKVKFNCTILAADGNTAVVLYNDEYILLHGKSKLQPGATTVIGTWVSNDVVKKGSQNINAYNVNVFSATQ
jgi:hypothetical protein